MSELFLLFCTLQQHCKPYCYCSALTNSVAIASSTVASGPGGPAEDVVCGRFEQLLRSGH